MNENPNECIYFATTRCEKNRRCWIPWIVANRTGASVFIIAFESNVTPIGRRRDRRQLVECQAGVVLPIGNGEANHRDHRWCQIRVVRNEIVDRRSPTGSTRTRIDLRTRFNSIRL